MKMKPPLSSSSSISLLKKIRLSPLLLTLIAFIIFLTILYSEDFSSQSNNNLPRSLPEIKKKRHKLAFAVGETEEGCDVFSGRWVRDEEKRPLYEEEECPYIQPQLTCQKHGRPEKGYQQWRWQPHRCSLPSFNATMMLENLRGKRMMFVGDSLNRGQFVSMVCLLHKVIPEKAKSMQENGSLTVFTAKDYNATIEFYWAPFLLESNSDDAIVHRIQDRVVRKASINKHGKHWKGVDIIIFNTYLWWMIGVDFKIQQSGTIEDKEKDVVIMSTDDAYRMAMKSMVRWVKKNMDPKRTRVFFTSMSPSHQRGEEGCDIFSGRWVRDDESRPLYDESDCPYLLPQQTCLAHGRPEKDYLYWKWQPHGCSIPGFNASLMLEALRGKRMMFAGDSLSRGHFSSMVCLLQKIIPQDAKSFEEIGQRTIFTAKEYNATVEFYWTPLLLESNADNPLKHRVDDRIVRKGSIDKHAQHWKGVDILVLHTYLWWFKDEYFKILLKGSFEDEMKETTYMLSEDAYRLGLGSMLKWVNENIDPKQTRVFFTGMSPTHGMSVEWGGDRNGNCFNQTSMIQDLNYKGPKSWEKTLRVIDEVLSESNGVVITYLNITKLSNYRKDGHTSIYKKQWGPLTPEQLANPVSYADCIHWCLPGVQDTWNELLFAKLFYP